MLLFFGFMLLYVFYVFFLNARKVTHTKRKKKGDKKGDRNIHKRHTHIESGGLGRSMRFELCCPSRPCRRPYKLVQPQMSPQGPKANS